MATQDLTQEQKLQVILCGPLPQTEAALLQRSDVEIHREKDNFNLLAYMDRDNCDMIIVEAPYGHGLYSMTYPVDKDKRCPVWMVADPPNETVWKEINWQLDGLPAIKNAARERAIRMGPPRNEVLILADDPQRRSDLSGWTRDIFAGWDMTPEVIAPEDVKTYQREMHDRNAQDKPPMMVIIAREGVDGLNTAEHIRDFYPRCGLIWCSDLDFAMQAFHFHADDFFFLHEISREKLERGLNKWRPLMDRYKERGNIL